jgi:hypothetical protein
MVYVCTDLYADRFHSRSSVSVRANTWLTD